MGDSDDLSGIDLSRPRYDQSTYVGRARHFFDVCDPRTILATPSELDRAKAIVVSHKAGADAPGTTADDLWRAKKVYDSAFHSETGELLFLPGRMSFQAVGNMVITGCMLIFLKTTPQVVFWQTVNQSFNACVNYTNRNASSPVSTKQLGLAYVGAVSAAVSSSIALGRFFDKFRALRTPLARRFVPMISVAAANAINIPLMRSSELANGISVSDEDGKELGMSRRAAEVAIPMVIASRVLMAFPSVAVPNLIMSRLETRPFLKKNPAAAAPLMVGLVGINLVFSTPLACALFPQTASLAVDSVEDKFRNLTRADGTPVEKVFFNKGL